MIYDRAIDVAKSYTTHFLSIQASPQLNWDWLEQPLIKIGSPFQETGATTHQLSGYSSVSVSKIPLLVYPVCMKGS